MRISIAIALILSATVYSSEGRKTRDLKDVPLKYIEDLSFRGVADNGTISHFEGSGLVGSVPGVRDYVRLAPALPSAYGALFSEKRLDKKKDWVVEIGFRVHGPAYAPLIPDTINNKDDASPKSHKGGRGFAFFLSTDALAGDMTYTSREDKEPAKHPDVRPFDQHFPHANKGLDDENAAFFGYKDRFRGLSIVFDTSPRSPVWLRSNPTVWSPDGKHSSGADMRGVISVLKGDGYTSFLDPPDRVIKPNEEVSYLQKSLGDCEVAFRNLNGLLWARISYIDGTLKVDLDLSPHTTLSKVDREYAHNCVAIPNLKLPINPYHVGVSGLAGTNSEPDTIDIYALDMFEVSKYGIPGQDDAPDDSNNKPLEGTGDEEPDVGMLHELFASQVRVIEAVDSLSRRIDSLSPIIAEAIEHSQNLVSYSKDKASQPNDAWDHADTIARIHQRLESISANSRGSSSEGGGSVTIPEDVGSKLEEIQDLLEKLRTISDSRLSSIQTNMNTYSSRLNRISEALSAMSTSLTKITETSLSWIILVLGLPLLFGSGFIFGRLTDSRHRDKKLE